jgi:hypothetical protein
MLSTFPNLSQATATLFQLQGGARHRKVWSQDVWEIISRYRFFPLSCLFCIHSLGHLLVIDFSQIDPASTRYKDCIIHVYSHIPGDATNLASEAFHYIGQEASVQPNNPGFIIQAIENLFQLEQFQHDELDIIFCDNGMFIPLTLLAHLLGPKDFNSTFLAYLPTLQKTTKRRIVINNFAENHGMLLTLLSVPSYA